MLLAQRLDSHLIGYPRTENVVEIPNLRQLSIPAEAELALHLFRIEESASLIARLLDALMERSIQTLENVCNAVGDVVDILRLAMIFGWKQVHF